jgi:hypothetical protein
VRHRAATRSQGAPLTVILTGKTMRGAVGRASRTRAVSDRGTRSRVTAGHHRPGGRGDSRPASARRARRASARQGRGLCRRPGRGQAPAHFPLWLWPWWPSHHALLPTLSGTTRLLLTIPARAEAASPARRRRVLEAFGRESCHNPGSGTRSDSDCRICKRWCPLWLIVGIGFAWCASRLHWRTRRWNL